MKVKGTPKEAKHKRWIRGVDYSEFSGKSWHELEDVWPTHVRLASEAWKIVSVIGPAGQAARRFHRTLLNGKEVPMQSLYMLCWIQRCEEARASTATAEHTIRKLMELSISLMPIRMSLIIKLGLVEKFQFNETESQPIYMFRVTELGKIIIRNFVENIEQGHRNLKTWVENEPPEVSAKINKWMSSYCFEWKEFAT